MANVTALKEAPIGHATNTSKGTCSVPANAASNNASSGPENPVPSITLSITQDDVKRVLEASEALSKKLIEMQQQEEQRMDAIQTEGGISPFTADSSLKGATGTTGDPISAIDKEDDGRGADDTSTGLALRPTVSTSEDESTKDATTITASRKSKNGAKYKRPLHELIYHAARECENSMLQSFLDRMKYSGSSTREIKAGIMVFSEMDLNLKIRRIFDVLGEGRKSKESSNEVETKSIGGKGKDDEPGKSLSRDGALSLFRAVIVAIASCIHKNAKVQIEMRDKENGEQPRVKRRKPNTPEGSAKKIDADKNDVLKNVDSVPSLQTPTVSFDNSIPAPIKEENYVVKTSSVRKEFEEIAVYATDRLVKFAVKKSGNVDKNSSSGIDGVEISFAIFQSWRRAEGARIAPWLDLLNLSRWKTPQRSNERSSAPPQTKNQTQQATKPKPSTQPALSHPKPVPEQVKSNPPPLKKSPSVESSSTVQKNEKPVEQKPKMEPIKKVEPVTSTSMTQAVTQVSSQPAPYVSNNTSRTVLSFDFSGSIPEEEGEKPFCITITEESLKTFRGLVERTGLIGRSCHDITTILLDASKTRVHQGVERKVITIERFHTCLHQLLGSGSSQRLSKLDRDVFSSCLVDFFGCFNPGIPPLESGEAFTHELAVGFCFLCAGNKSSKLATGFEFLEKQIGVGLTNNQLVHFLRSYLTMLAGISFLTSSPDGIMRPKLNSSTRKLMYSALENGARWTLGHFLKDTGLPENDTDEAKHTFEAFASWYSNGGFNTAPWLELLDLKKILSLVDDLYPKSPAMTHDALPAFPGLKPCSPEFLSPRPTRSHHSLSRHRHPHSVAHHVSNSNGLHLPPFGHSHPPPAVQILFNFPLANQCSLVVLKEDATYVREVVDQLGLLPYPPEEIWSTLHSLALKQMSFAAVKKNPKNVGKTMLINKASFVECMQETIQSKVKTSKKRAASGQSKSISDNLDVLANLFKSFDLGQVDQVALNELMGGLTLLCGGKKSTKLSFAFSLFDRRQLPKKKGRKNQPCLHSLDGEELFLFLRSFLIITFSCCRQSWDLSGDAVNRYIADTANMVTDDVMRYQWRTRKRERLDFEEFGRWYNEGGYETAPWLELLDLTKWVLVESFDSFEKHEPPVDMTIKHEPPSPGLTLGAEPPSPDPDCPPAPPDAEMDGSFFDDDANNILPMDSIDDEMDLILMQHSSQDKDDAEITKLVKSFPFSPRYSPKPSPKVKNPPQSQNSMALKIYIITDDNHDGYVFSMSQKRISHLRHILMECELHKVDCEKASKEILAKAYRDTKSNSLGSTYVLTKDGFDSAMRKVIVSRTMSVDTQRTLSTLLNDIFFAFDYDRVGKANALDIACGFTLLCRGKKSDKLEFAFETLDREKRGVLKRSDVTRYLRSFLLVLVKMASASSLDSDFIDDTMTMMNGGKCDCSVSSMAKAVEMGCEWATVQAIKGGRSLSTISFDDFAEWYTRVGHSNIGW
eukprot:CAMPEP_0172374362 /NCGR_PEP_ID=MMETSP1060-20121228/55495_1 /TAXON_ID=37318 /ORGANISM="Pseudo-nitzschia pungens, Strain cf. cingulata" /LENGTH=1486 /DNA_ID=CAMNT_0013100997 /DNA_START=320 /DNA_END=4777 /DNA_ORIENTATION=-